MIRSTELLTIQDALDALPIPPRRISGDATHSHTPMRLVCDDSRRACPDALFVCIRGTAVDGHAYIPAAYAAGCRAFLVERIPNPTLPSDANVYLSEDTRRDLAHLACNYYGHPARDMTIVGITGTKGKTTVALMCHHISERAGISAGYIGTAGIRYGNVRLSTSNTTPAPLQLQATLADMYRAGVRTVFLEVSSQALWQKRVDGIPFTVAVLTNLSHDHIGAPEHPDFSHYAASKRRLLCEFAPPVVIAWGDDPHADSMLCDLPGHVVRCGSTSDADIQVRELTSILLHDIPGIRFTLRLNGESLPITLPLPGAHNAANAALAISIAKTLEMDPSVAADALRDLYIPGRFDVLSVNGALVVIDYAHNGASLRASLESLRPYTRGRLRCLCGSVGERSQSRRAEIGRAAALADFVYLTALEPNNEPVEHICAEIAAALPPSCPCRTIPDRTEAILFALGELTPGDTLLISGKGDDTEMLLGGKMIPHNDRAVVENYLKRSALPLA